MTDVAWDDSAILKVRARAFGRSEHNPRARAVVVGRD